MSDATGGGHGNKGMDMAKTAIAILAAVGIGLFVAALGIQQLGAGLSSFIRDVGMAITTNMGFAILIAAVGLAIVAGTLFMALKATKDS